MKTSGNLGGWDRTRTWVEPRRRFGLPCAVAGAWLVLVACESGTNPGGEGTVHRDPAGVMVAETRAPLWTEGDGWTVRAPAVVEIGGTGPGAGVHFGEVAGVVRLRSGQIVVADRMSAELSLFSANGVLEWRAGGHGDGPGEFRDIDVVGALPGDSVLAYDRRLGRVQVFSPDGQFARGFAVRPERGVPGDAVGLAGGGLVVRLSDTSETPGQGVVGWPRQIVAVAGLEDGLLDERFAVDGCEQLVSVTDRDGVSGVRQEAYTFGKCPVLAATANRLAVGQSSECSFRVQGVADSANLEIRRQCDAEAVTDAVLETYVDAVVAMAFPEGTDPASDEVTAFRASYRRGPKAATLPVVRSALYDDAGNLWVEPYWVLGSAPPPYEVFAPDGTWLGAVALPDDLDRGFIPEMAPRLHIGSDFVLGTWRDETDTHVVRMYRIEK